jgi:hypothetical protein
MKSIKIKYGKQDILNSPISFKIIRLEIKISWIKNLFKKRNKK